MRGSKRRAAILASAAPIFNRRGFAGTSIADILEATELEKGGLYNHFASKEELAVEAFDYAYAQVDAYFTKALLAVAPGLARIRAYIDAFERYCERPVIDGGCPVMNVCIEADDALPFLRERVADAFQVMRALVHRNLRRAVSTGELRATMDLEQATDFVVASLEGAVLLVRGLRSRAHSRNVCGALRAWLDEQCAT
ncbi:MAG TPA: TetR/AcrR family transcriptional regulator [Candidatus Baltobacteraceae bacterium]|nr:TetR/AcrR family transcriptional regulator [Candidatus Baltobacteraceae bacterium]